MPNSTAAPMACRYQRRAFIPLCVATVILMACLSLAGCPRQPAGTQRIRIHGRAFNLELALTPPHRYRGLSDRQELPADGGMLFVFPQPRRLQFVMRRCLIPIDLVYLDPSGRVVAMHAMSVEPYDRPEGQLKRYTSHWPAQFAIELAGGTLRGLELELGSKIDLPLADLNRRAR